MGDVKPWHDAPTCPECGDPVATPWAAEDSTAPAAELFCPACGHRWTEADGERIGQAWTSWRAYEARQCGRCHDEHDADERFDCRTCGRSMPPCAGTDDGDDPQCDDCWAAIANIREARP